MWVKKKQHWIRASNGIGSPKIWITVGGLIKFLTILRSVEAGLRGLEKLGRPWWNLRKPFSRLDRFWPFIADMTTCSYVRLSRNTKWSAEVGCQKFGGGNWSRHRTVRMRCWNGQKVCSHFRFAACTHISMTSLQNGNFSSTTSFFFLFCFDLSKFIGHMGGRAYGIPIVYVCWR